MRVAAGSSARARRSGCRLSFVGVALSLAVISGCASGGESTGSLPGVASSTTSTVAPTTTQAPTPATGEIRQAVVDYWAASRACGQRPSRCQPDAFTATAGSLRDVVRTFAATLVAQGYHLAVDAGPSTSSTDPNSVAVNGGYVSVETITIDPASAGTARTTECVYDPTPLLGPPDADGRPTVVSVTPIPRRFQHTLYLEAGRWLVGEEQVDPDTTECSSTGDTVQVVFTTPPR